MSEKKAENGLIRKMNEQDIDQVFLWRNHIDVRRFMFSQKEITIDEHRNWFNKVSQEKHRHLLVFEVRGVPSGSVNFSQLNTGLVANWGFYLAPDAPKGTGRKLGLAALDYAFDDLGLHKVCGRALGFNDRSIKFHLSLGFKQEGILKNQHFDGQNFHNIVCFGILAHEWKQICNDDS